MMNKRIREELLELYKDRWALIINVPALSLPPIVLLFSYIHGNPYLLLLILYSIIIYGIFFNSAYIWLAWKKTAPIGVAGKESRETFAPKYPSLRPFGMAGVVLSLLLIPIFGFVPPFKGP